MGLGFDYTKLVVENIGKIIPAVLLLITGLTSAFGYVVSDNWNNKKEKDQAIREVATAFQSVMAEKTPDIIVKTPSCGKCMTEIEKLKRWH
jgi:hypothetical protein